MHGTSQEVGLGPWDMPAHPPAPHPVKKVGNNSSWWADADRTTQPKASFRMVADAAPATGHHWPLSVDGKPWWAISPELTLSLLKPCANYHRWWLVPYTGRNPDLKAAVLSQETVRDDWQRAPRRPGYCSSFLKILDMNLRESRKAILRKNSGEALLIGWNQSSCFLESKAGIPN